MFERLGSLIYRSRWMVLGTWPGIYGGKRHFRHKRL